MSETGSRPRSPVHQPEITQAQPQPEPQIQSPEELFRSEVESAFNNLYSEVGSIKAILEKFVAGSEQSRAQPDVHYRTLPAPPGYEASEASSNTRQLQEKYEKQRKEIDQLKREVNKKTNDIRKLHDIIQSGQDDNELSDEDIDKRFGSLKTQIQNFSRSNLKKFRSSTTKPGWSSMKEGDKGFWVDAHIADRLCDLIFNARLYPLKDDALRNTLETLELRLLQSDAPRDAVNSWRAETARIVRNLDQHAPGRSIRSIADKIYDELNDYLRFDDTDKAFGELDTLCIIAYELAISLRESKIAFFWQQLPHGSNIAASHYNRHNGYTEPLDESGQLLQCRILFGAVFKTNGTESLCIRKGELLHR